MTYFDPKIYCKQNLLDADRRELEFWHDEILGMIEGAKPDEFESSRKPMSSACSALRTILKNQTCISLYGNVMSCIERKAWNERMRTCSGK